jgi:hypothetical protein
MKRAIFFACAIAVLLLLGFFGVFAPPRGGAPPPDLDGPITGSAPPIEPTPDPSVTPTVPPTTSLPKPSPSPLPDFAAIDRALEALPLGSIAFNVSTPMTLSRSENVHLLLSPSVPVEALQKQLVERLAREGKVEGVQIRIGDRMEARLSGTNFAILAVTPEIQPVTWNEPTEWQWEVRPTAVGNQTLHLTLTAVMQINGVDSTRAIRTFDRDIQVQVTWPQRISGFAAENWQWLWTTLAVPIALWLWGKRRKKRRGVGFLD